MMSLRRSVPLLVSALALTAGLAGAAVRPLLAHHVVVVEGSLVYENGGSTITRVMRATPKTKSRDAAGKAGNENRCPVARGGQSAADAGEASKVARPSGGD